eukprot:TRINITY_DN13534_c0_g1_i1.p1 TRINITY_DN13534_c0_g1~~TRINITY_DN13534_c0_g1_i1.p1  ORF type:complete len:369 (+),score=29.09 TRINITY_DN13534_c0_g1_i1:210-1316(+)
MDSGISPQISSELSPILASYEASKTGKRKGPSGIKACILCQKSHVSCDSVRPCKRCVDRGTSHLCVDPQIKKRGRKPNPVSEELKEHIAEALSSNVQPLNIVENGTPGTTDDSLSMLLDLPDGFLRSMLLSTWEAPDFVPPCVAAHYLPTEGPLSALATMSAHHYTPLQAEHLAQGAEFLKSRLPESQANEMIQHLSMRVRPMLQKMLTKEVSLQIVSEFKSLMKTLTKAYNESGFPCMIWDNAGVIHYVNQPYKNLTGFSLTLPTTFNSFAAYEQLSPGSLSKMLLFMMSSLQSADSTTFMLPTEWKAYDKYLDCMISVTIKKDANAFPLLVITTVIPILSFPVMLQQISHQAKINGFTLPREDPQN